MLMKFFYCIYLYKKCDIGFDNLNIYYRFVILCKYLFNDFIILILIIYIINKIIVVRKFLDFKIYIKKGGLGGYLMKGN